MTTTTTTVGDPLTVTGRQTRAVVGPVVRPWRWALALAALCMVSARALELVPALIVQRVVDQRLTPDRPEGLLTLGLLYLGAVVAAQAVNFVAMYLTAADFGYQPGTPVVRGVSFTVHPGEQVALVGRTGAGKTSIVRLIAGLYPLWEGQITVAGRDPRTLSDDERRSVVGIVPQQVQLFSATVRENLTLGDAIVPQAAIERAMTLTGATGMVAALPQGYDTRLQGAGRGAGMHLSAGQRQLLALTRRHIPGARAVTAMDEMGGEARTDAIDAVIVKTQRPPRLRPRTRQAKEGCFLHELAGSLPTLR